MKETRTYQNLMNSFVGESQAQQRYKMYAKVAKKEGWNNISEIFLETAHNEYYHAQEFYNLMLEISGEEDTKLLAATAMYPVAKSSTYNNLISAATGENEEFDVYNEFAEIAKEEGFTKASAKFSLVAKVEKHHAERYEKIIELLKVEQLVSRNEEVLWKCDVCGHIHYGKRAPKLCPICSHNFGHFTKFEFNI